MNKRPLFIVIYFLLMVVAPGAGATTITIRDELSREVEVSLPVKRVVFISLYEFIPALQIWERVVGINRWAFDNTLLKRFAELKRMPPVGTGGEVNIEALLALRPDLVITWTYKPEVVDFMARKGLRVISVYPESIEELYEVLELCGRLFKKEGRVRKVRSYMDRLFDLIKFRVSGIPAEKRRKVLWLWGKPTTVTGCMGVQSDIIKLIGGINPAECIQAKYSDVSIEWIVAWDPDVIFIWGNARYGSHDLIGNSQWATIKAIKEGRVYKAPSWSNWSPRLPILALWMAKKTYPEAFSGISFTQLADDLYVKCFGIPFEGREFD